MLGLPWQTAKESQPSNAEWTAGQSATFGKKPDGREGFGYRLEVMANSPLCPGAICGHWRRRQGHFTTGGIDDRIDSTLPPVFNPNVVPRS
jgi:hypothetical protein